MNRFQHLTAAAVLVLGGIVFFGRQPLFGEGEENAIDPALLGMTVVIENIGPGFLKAAMDQVTDCLYADFFVFVSDIEANRDKIKSLRIEWPDGTGWDINLATYQNLKDGYLGGYGRWYSDTAAIVGRTLLPLKYRAKMTLTDGRVIQGDFNLPPPVLEKAQTAIATAVPQFLVNSAFKGMLTAYHLLAPEPARIRSLYSHNGTLYVDFTLDGPPVANCQLDFYDESGSYIGDSSVLRSDPSHAVWLNGGSSLRFSGGLNHIAFPLDSARWHEKKSSADLAGVALKTTDRQPVTTNLLRLDYLYVTRTGIVRCGADSSQSPELLSEAARKAQTQAGSSPRKSPPAWDGRPDTRRAWELRLAGILSQINGYGFDQLAPFTDSDANRTKEAASIKASWGIVDRKTMIENLQQLYGSGNSARYSRYQAIIEAHPGGQPAVWLAAAADPALTAAGFAFVNEFRGLTGKRGLRAWDLSRLIYLARDGFALGHLSETETWEWLDKAADVLRDDYVSWLDFGDNYLIGRMFWGGDGDGIPLYFKGSRAMKALFSPDGGWTGQPWPTRKNADSDCDQDLK